MKNTRICCPYDGAVCEEKRKNWAIAGAILAAHRIRVELVYKDSDTSLDNCLRSDTEMQKCERYQAYLQQQKIQNNGR